MSLNDQVANEIVAHHVRVLRVARGTSEQIVKFIGELDKQTFAALTELTNGDGAITRVDRAVQVIYKINQMGYKKIGAFLADELRGLAVHEVNYAHALMDTLAPKTTFAKPKVAYVRAIVDEEPFFGGLLSEWVAGLAQGRFQRIRNLLRLSSAAKEDVADLIRKIRGQKKFGYRDGVSNVSLRSAKTLVNTTYNHVANKARYDFFTAKKKKKNKDYGIEGFVWSAVLDELTCTICDSLDGQYFEAEEYYAIQSSTHPNCRCVGIPLIDVEEYEFARPKKLVYGQWLEKQSASFQDEILGPARAAMFRRGMPLKKFVDASGIKYNLSELRTIEDKMTARKHEVNKRAKGVKPLKNFGWRPDLPDRRDHMFSLVHPVQVQLPPKLSLRDKFTFPVFDQGELGSCVANACCSQHMFVHKDEAMMSRLDLYWSARFLEGTVDEDSGVMIRDGVKALQKFGVCTEKTWPYRIRKFAVDPPPAADKEALQYRITSYSRLSSLQDFQNCLAKGYPFVFGFSVYSNIDAAAAEKYGILTMPDDTMQLYGGHAVIAIGYDTDFHSNPIFKKSGLSTKSVPSFMFECRNSWSADWGDGGHFWIPADYLNDRNLSDDFWVVHA